MGSETQERSTFTFHCAGEDGGWLALRGPVLLDHDDVMECVAALMTGVRGCFKVSVWVEDERVLTVCRKGERCVQGSGR